MTAHLHPYASYKPFSVLWLGNVPGHWETPRLKGYVKNAIDLTRAPIDGELYLALEHVESWTGRFSEAGNGVSFSGQVKRFHTEDVLFGKLRPYLAKVTCPKRNGVCVGEFLVLRPHDARLSPLYLEQLLRSKPVIDAIDSSTFGAKMPRADWQFIGDLLFPLPPIPEQAAIVRYLDHVDRRVRRYIVAKRRLIALMEEERQAVVNRAVTRGLDPNVRLKSSGVEWLGDVPEHWERRRLKTVLQPIDRRSTTGSETLLSLRRDFGVVVYAEHFNRPSQSRSLVGFKLVRVGQLVVNRLQANNGLVFNSTVDGLVSPDYSVFEKKSPLEMKFLSDLLRTSAYRVYFRQNATGLGTGTAGFLRLYDDAFLETPVYLPPNLEQSAIIEHIDKATGDIDAAVDRTRRQIALVQEYRTRLIADVVTGKLDVRDVAAQLVDETDVQDPIEGDGPLTEGMDEDPYEADNFREELAMESEVTA